MCWLSWIFSLLFKLLILKIDSFSSFVQDVYRKLTICRVSNSISSFSNFIDSTCSVKISIERKLLAENSQRILLRIYPVVLCVGNPAVRKTNWHPPFGVTVNSNSSIKHQGLHRRFFSYRRTLDSQNDWYLLSVGLLIVLCWQFHNIPTQISL